MSFFSRFQKCYNESHWKNFKNVLRYIKSIEKFGLKFCKSYNNEGILEAYVDSNFAKDINDRKNITGYIIKCYDNVVCWKTKKQTTV